MVIKIVKFGEISRLRSPRRGFLALVVVVQNKLFLLANQEVFTQIVIQLNQ